jgi:CubicO group peptidase (beta-lactamase class C family)
VTAAVLSILLLARDAAMASPAPPPVDVDIHRMLVDRVDNRGYGSGIVVGVVSPAGRRIVAFGTLARGDARPMGGDTVFWTASLTKVFTALLLSEMASRGEVSPQDPVARFLPRPADRMPRSGDRVITLADLATMTSGLPAWPNNLPSRDRANPFEGYTTSSLYAFVANAPSVPVASRKYIYSDTGFGLLGQALANCGGADWASLIQARITAPLGLKDTLPNPDDGMRQRQAIEYAANGAPTARRDMGALQGAGALNSTASDLLTLLDALLGRGPTDWSPLLDTMLSVRRPGGQPPAAEAALGWNIYRVGNRELIWKDGYQHAFMGLDRATGVGVVVLANGYRPEGVNALGLHVLDPDIPLEPTH